MASATQITNFSSTSAGNAYTCGVAGSGVKCWGTNGNGQLGNGTTATTSPQPTDVSSFSGTIVSASGGGAHTCALSSGNVYCWGANGAGTLGVDPNTTSGSTTPVAVTGPLSAADVSMGSNFSCALVGSGVKCWGSNLNSQLGRGTATSYEYQPANVITNVSTQAALTGAADLSAGSGHACVVFSGGGAACWGINTDGRLGHNTTSTSESLPVSVRNSSNVDVGGLVSISAGASHTCAVTSGGQALCWGPNNHGQLGNGTTTNSSYPVSVLAVSGGSALTGIVQISAGGGHTCALMATSGVKCWGTAGDFPIGFYSASDVLIPSDVLAVSGEPLRGVVSISTGPSHTCAVMTDSTMKCWGANYHTQLAANNVGGTCGFSNSYVPVDITSDMMATLTIKSAAGHGSVSATKGCGGSPTSLTLTCGVNCVGDAQIGTQITLTATVTSGFTFGGWRGVACSGGNSSTTCQFYIKGNMTVTALENTRSDLNGNGKSDIVWYNDSSGDLFDLPMNGLTALTGGVIDTRSNLDWQVVAVADINGDGKSDVVWQNNTTGDVDGLLMNGLSVSSSGTIVTETDTDWKIVGSGDFDGDGKADLLWRNISTGGVRVQLLDGLTSTSITLVYVESDLDWVIKKVADFNADGSADILWYNTTTGDVFLQLMNGTSIISGNVIYSEPNTDWQIQLAADFNGDGKADILWKNFSTGDVFMMLMNGNTITSGSVIYTESNMAWTIVASGDYNGDGKNDILWRNTSTGDVFMMLMSGTTISSSGVVYTETNQDWKILGP